VGLLDRNHYHYHVSYWDGYKRQLDNVPYTARCFAETAMRLYFRNNERPKVKRLLASQCGADAQTQERSRER
jgi:hypothetical protein